MLMRRVVSTGLLLSALVAPAAGLFAAEYHVAVTGKDTNPGTRALPFRSIGAAATIARPGDVVTVHRGTYREWVNPPRGGESDMRPIVYRAAPGERAEIKGSEVVKGWQKESEILWKIVLPNTFFGGFNPYSDTIRGDWFESLGRIHHTGAVYLNGFGFNEGASIEDLRKPMAAIPLWFGRVEGESTTIWAQFKGVDPNRQTVEINVRRSVFFPERTGINYITVRGFSMMHAATNWAPPTAFQIGLVGPHWSRGWIIENNEISYSRCSGVSLGKYGDQWDNTSENSAEGYVKTIERGLASGWKRDNVGHHIVRNNVIHDCEQTGVVGSLGGIFSRIENNHIYDIWTRRLFNGAEIGGIKLHGAIDVVIRRNRIHNACRGIWLDWMAQGTRVSENVLYDHVAEDIFVEVNHGPFIVDNNIMLSEWNLSDASEGGAYVHNLFAGSVRSWPDAVRETPFHPPHSTAVAGLVNLKGGDNRFYNNVFLPPDTARPRESLGLVRYNAYETPTITGGNVYYNAARPYAGETSPVVVTARVPSVRLVERGRKGFLAVDFKDGLQQQPTQLISTAVLGRSKVAGARYEDADGSPVKIETDYFGRARNPGNPVAGPFAHPRPGRQEIALW
jgi:alpha-L-arabinofuranosidase